DDAAERDFNARWAQTAAVAAGLWQILAPEYEKTRGAAAREQADAAFVRLERAAVRGEQAGFAAARKQVARALDGFTAAPFTAEEQARRAGQLTRFVELIPVDYDHGTDDGKVTIPFEIQESMAFSDAAISAFSDLEEELSQRNPRATAEVGRTLERLRGYVEDARDGKAVASQDTMESTQGRASDMIDALLPDEWKQDDAQSDFDLITLTLDRMEAAVGAGQYAQAEQSRLEAYAFFEFGPELSLRSIAPDVTARVEGLIWFGADDKQGLAKLIANKRPRRDVHDTRLALDDALKDGAGSLGEGATAATAVTNAAVIVFREGLEAVLILAAVMASLTGAARVQRRPMLFGALLALVGTAVTFILARTVLTELARYGEKLEAVVGLVAIAVLLLVLNWFFHKVYWTGHIKKFNKRRRRLLGVTAGGLVSAQVLGFVLLGFSTVYREGFETVLFLQALELNSGLAVVLEGVALGGLAVAVVAVSTFVLERRLPYKKMLIVTGLLLTVVLMIMMGKTVRIMQGVGWVPITPIDIEVPYWTGIWLGIFPTVETMLAQLGGGVFVIGSYVVAERLKHRPRVRSARGDGPVASDGERRENGDQASAPHERHPDVGVRRRAQPQGTDRVGDGGERVGLRELPQAVRHRLHRHEDRRGEGQREDRREADRVRGLGRGREQPDQREDPRERIAEQQQEHDAGQDLADARVDEVEPGEEPDGEQDDERQAVEDDVGERAAGQHRGAGHRQRAEAVDQALLDVLGEPERGHEPAEGDRLDDDARHQEVHVVEAGRLDRAAEDVDEQQHEHDRLDRVGDQQVGLARDPQQVAPGEDERVLDRGHAACSSAAGASSSVGRPVSVRKTSSSVGRRSAMSSIATPRWSSRRTASVIAPRCSL
ncbi:MAG: high-affinity iron transporter, partial [Thermoleophilaceae bacterium]|nr:high-affinity iron transporter [Thermoleophilaceae bacterium]